MISILRLSINRIKSFGNYLRALFLCYLAVHIYNRTGKFLDEFFRFWALSRTHEAKTIELLTFNSIKLRGVLDSTPCGVQIARNKFSWFGELSITKLNRKNLCLRFEPVKAENLRSFYSISTYKNIETNTRIHNTKQ